MFDIWNGEKYTKLRMDHFDLTPSIKCTEQCDMKLIGNYLTSEILIIDVNFRSYLCQMKLRSVTGK